MTSFANRLRERKLFQWVVAYLAAAWLVLQLVDVLGPRWGLSDVVARIIDVGLFAGFFLALILAWYHGEQGRQHVSGPELLLIAGTAGIAALGLSFMTGEEVAPIDGSERSTRDRPSIVVLPFDNISPDPSDAYFAEGMQEQIIGQLAKISGLIVISRSSAMGFAESRPPILEIARALDVEFVLEGSARKAGDRIRLTAQLIDGRTDEHLWNQDFDRDLSVEDLFEIQDDLAALITRSLSARILPSEAETISELPTSSTVAYQHYLRGLSHWARRSEFPRRVAAVEAFRDAVAVDSTFGIAWARLASACLWLRQIDANFGNWRLPDMGFDARELLREAQTALRYAEELVPDARETHMARGNLYYHGFRDLPRALAELSQSRRVFPEDPLLGGILANVQRRAGDWDSALQGHLEQLGTAPTPQNYYTAAMSARMMRRYDQGLQLAEQGLNLANDFRNAWTEKYRGRLQMGDTAGAWQASADYRAIAGPDARPAWQIDEARIRYGHVAAAQLNAELRPADTMGVSHLVRTWFAGGEVPADRVARQIEQLNTLVTEWTDAGNRFGALYQRSRVVLVKAVGGQGDETATEVEWLLDQDPMSVDALVGWNVLQNAVIAAIVLGETDLAVRGVEDLLSRPSYLSVELFLIDPVYEALWEAPSFQAVIDKYRSTN